ncbi:hypothetical protein BDB01DRAFT_851756 [Pilobolus umbonatus]|nr:hypothetical protein BDB01DRAFT_851756 [Pilobolus umbonatus]
MSEYTSNKKKEEKGTEPGDCQLYEMTQYECATNVHHIECTPFVRLFLRCANIPTVEVTPVYDHYDNPYTRLLYVLFTVLISLMIVSGQSDTTSGGAGAVIQALLTYIQQNPVVTQEGQPTEEFKAILDRSLNYIRAIDPAVPNQPVTPIQVVPPQIAEVPPVVELPIVPVSTLQISPILPTETVPTVPVPTSVLTVPTSVITTLTSMRPTSISSISRTTATTSMRPSSTIPAMSSGVIIDNNSALLIVIILLSALVTIIAL